MDIFEDTYCHQCRERTRCEPVARRDAQGQIAVKVLCNTCRLDEGNTQAVDELLSDVKRWVFRLRRSNKSWDDKKLSCSAYTTEILQLVADTYVPEPQRGIIHEVLRLCDID